MSPRLALAVLLVAGCAQTPPAGWDIPDFPLAPRRPRPLPEEDGVQPVLGQVAACADDEHSGRVGLVHRQGSHLQDEWNAKEKRPVTHRCCRSMPPVVQFDAAGNLVRAWEPSGSGFDWPKTEHGIYVDPEGNVWL